MKEYVKYSGRELFNYVINSSNKRLILQDKDFKDYLLQDSNHYAFVWLVQELSLDDIKVLLDNCFLKRIIEIDSRKVDKYNSIITSCSDILIYVDNNILSYILNDDFLKDYFYGFSFNAANKFLEYVIAHEPKNITFISYLDAQTQCDLLTPDNVEKISKIKEFNEIFLKLSPIAIKRLLHYEKYKNIVKDFSPSSLIKFSSSIQSISIDDVLMDSSFIFNIATIENPNYYRNIVNNLSNCSCELVIKIEKLRKKYVKRQFELIDENGIFLTYNYLANYILKKGIDNNIYDKLPLEFYEVGLNGIDTEFLKDLTKKRMFEMLCDAYFHDYARNVLYNINEVVKFNNNENIISDDMLNLYMKFLNFNELDDQQIQDLVMNIDNKEYVKSLYEDYKRCKEISFENYNKELLKLDENPNLYSKELSAKAGIDVYYLDGEDFFACVHCGNYNQNRTSYKTISLSFIGTENIGVFDDNKVIVGFSKLSSDRIIHVYNEDSFSQKQYGSSRVNHIYRPHEILQQTFYYNEVLYDEKNGGNLLPSYVVCMDKINENSYNYAVKNNLPIVVINTKKYKTSKCNLKRENYQKSYETKGDSYFAK